MKNARIVLLTFALIINGVFAQEFCPVENVSALGGDGQNIISWDEPANPFLVTFNVAITTDSWPSEISWNLVSAAGTELFSTAPGDMSVAAETYTWDIDIEQGAYVFTIFDSFGDGNSGGFVLSLDGSVIYTFDGSEAYEELSIEFDTQQGWFGVTAASYLNPFPYEKGEDYDMSIVNSLELTDPIKLHTGTFEIARDVPVECGVFSTYKVYRGNGSLLGETTDLQYTHTGLTNGTEVCYYVKVVYTTDAGTQSSANSATVCATPESWEPAAPSDLLSFPGDEEMLLVWQSPGGGGGDGTQGDKIENPFVVTGLPFSTTGTTVGFTDDYDEECPYTGSTSPDVVYMMTSTGGTYDFTLCEDSQYDTKIYIYDMDQVNVACNDDDCTTAAGVNWVSQLLGVSLDAGVYYVVVDGYGGAEGEYTLDITAVTQNAEPDVVTNQTRTQYDFLGYNVYVDAALSNTTIVESNSYTATGLTNEVTYEFGVAAVYEGPAGGDNYESALITVSSAAQFLFGDVTGVITDPNGATLDSVVVTAEGVSDTTGTDGVYTLMNLNVGTHIVQASRRGFYTNTAEVAVLAQAAPTVQDIQLSPDVPSPVALTAEPGDEEVHLSWRTPGAVSEYDIAYYDDVFEGQIGCGAGGCAFGVRFTPANYPATLQGFVLSMQGDAGSTAASVDVYLDPNGAVSGPTGNPITVVANADLSSPDGNFVQYSFDVSNANIEVLSGDIYIVVNDGGGFLGIADDLEPISAEYFDRNWVTTGYGWNTIADEYYGLAGDFGILASFLGAPGQASYAVTASGDVEESPNLNYGRISNFSSNQSLNQGIDLNNENLLSELYIPSPIPSLNQNSRDDVLQTYNIYLVADDGTSSFVVASEDTFETITVAENYVNYCYNVKAQWDTGLETDGGYGVLESRPSNTACAIPFAFGDANFDSETTIADVLAIVDFILEETVPSDPAFNNSDVNMDGELNIADVVMVVDIIAGGGLARTVTAGGSLASVDFSMDHQKSELKINLDYTDVLKGMQFDINFDPEIIEIGSPNLSIVQDNVIITHSNTKEGVLKVIVLDLQGESINTQVDNFITVPYSFKGNNNDIANVGLENIMVSGPRGQMVEVASHSVSTEVKLVPGVFALHQNYPNPFNPKTEIRFDLPEASKVEISIFNLMGQKVRTLSNEEISSGYHVMQWDGTNDKGSMVSTGMYFYTLSTNKYNAMRKMLFLK